MTNKILRKSKTVVSLGFKPDINRPKSKSYQNGCVINLRIMIYYYFRVNGTVTLYSCSSSTSSRSSSSRGSANSSSSSRRDGVGWGTAASERADGSTGHRNGALVIIL